MSGYLRVISKDSSNVKEQYSGARGQPVAHSLNGPQFLNSNCLFLSSPPVPLIIIVALTNSYYCHHRHYNFRVYGHLFVPSLLF